MKKLICLLLAGLMLLSLVACGTGDENSAETTKNDVANEGESEDSNFSWDLGELDYKKAEVRIIYANCPGREDELVCEEGADKGVIGEAVFERNEMVQSQIGVTLKMIDGNDDVATKVKTDISGRNGDYDIVVNGTFKSVTPAMNGDYLDLSRIDTMDTSKHYWTQGYNDMVTFTAEGRQFLASGPVAISMFRLMYLTIYNRTLFEANREADLYDVVMNGEWTLDYQYKILTGKYVDTSGDSKRNKEDSYGFVTGNIVSVDPYMVAADVHMIVKDPETRAMSYNDAALKPLSDLVDKVQKIYNDAGTYVFDGATLDDVDKNNIVETFALGRSMMATIMFRNMEHNFQELVPMNYAIAPIPKFSKEQKEYHSYVQDQVSSFGISSVVGDVNRQEMLGAVLESLAYHSYRIVRPAYYDKTLSTRYMQDPQSAEVLALLFDSLSFDFSSSCSNIITSCVLRDNLRGVLSGKSNRVSSTTAGWKRAVNSTLNTLNNKLESMD